MLAEAAQHNVKQGAHIIDINMGCPAKKVCNVMAGSALLQNEKLVSKILESVVKAVDVPVTLKIRTGWDTEHRNGVTIAKIAEQSGIQALAIHGRTRACAYKGNAEYDTIAEIKSALSIPIIANGDITNPEKAKFILDYTQADGLMIGRAAQGNPWIFRQINYYLEHGEHISTPPVHEVQQILTEHMHALYAFYGDYTGVRMARKHIAWYSKGLRNGNPFRQQMNTFELPQQQLDFTEQFFNQLAEQDTFAA
jgi:tRNA-dihydrouridine synthase B